MIIREWLYEDIARIEKLERKCFSVPWNYNMLATTFLNPRFRGILVEENETLVAYGGYIFSDDAEIALVATDEDFRNRGIATKMLETIEQQCIAEDMNNIFLEVRVSNNNAFNLYKKNGYTVIATRKRYYPDGEDAYVMCKALKRTFEKEKN